MSNYDSVERRNRLASERFLDCPAPMTAKSIIRDEIKDGTKLSNRDATDLAVSIIARMAIYGYEITERKD